MDDASIEHLKYPIGRYRAPEALDASARPLWTEAISSLPGELSASVQGLNDSQLDTPYREGGWTVRQLVHHVADSHLNSQIRFRWALTEDVPLIKAYDEQLWAELPDAKTTPIHISLELVGALHRRWSELLNRMTERDFNRRLRHPESGETTLHNMLSLYAWHGRHHVAHVSRLRERMNW